MRESYLDGVIHVNETLRTLSKWNSAYRVEGKNSRGGHIELSGETDVNVITVGQSVSLMALEQRSPAV